MSTSVGSDGATGSPAAPHGKKKRGTATYVVWGLLAFMVFWAILSIVMAPEVESIEKFKPQNEFGLHPWVSINLGPLDLSINKAVMYLALSSLIAIIFGLVVVKRGLAEKPGDGQNILEIAYEFIENTIAKATLPPKMFARYFPYVATLFLFIAINNLISFIPLPGGEESAIGWVPDLGLYAATANLNVTLALTLCTFFIYNYEGIREHGPFGYLKTFVPAGDIHPIMKAVVFALEFLSNILRLVSLSVRLFASGTGKVHKRAPVANEAWQVHILVGAVMSRAMRTELHCRHAHLKKGHGIGGAVAPHRRGAVVVGRRRADERSHKRVIRIGVRR